jgi:hypothetical protein
MHITVEFMWLLITTLPMCAIKNVTKVHLYNVFDRLYGAVEK